MRGCVVTSILFCSLGAATFAEASTPQINGAAGNVEYWYPLNALPRQPVTFIVTHDSWGAVGTGRNTARSQSGGSVGSEWWVLAEGTIIHSDRERRTGHCGENRAPGVSGDCNARSVGIEFEGFGRLTQAQVRSGLALIRLLQERYCIKPTDIFAHRKAPNEGVPMMQAAQNVGYKPNCTGVSPAGDLPQDVIAGAAQSSHDAPQSVRQAYEQQYAPYYQPPPNYQPQALPGSQYILNPSPSAPPALQPSQGSVGAPTPGSQLLQYYSLSAGEGDAVTIEESKKLEPLKSTSTIFIIYPASTSSLRAMPLEPDTKAPTSVSVTPFAVATTFEQAESGTVSAEMQSTSSQGTFVFVLTQLRDILSRLLAALGRLVTAA